MLFPKFQWQKSINTNHIKASASTFSHTVWSVSLIEIKIEQPYENNNLIKTKFRIDTDDVISSHTYDNTYSDHSLF